jgi:hypothetical protein
MSDDKTIRITATSHFEDVGQMNIQELPGAIPYGQTALPIGATQVAFADQERSDEKHRYVPCGGPEEAGVGS